MRNGPVLWAEILRVVRDVGGINPIIAGGAVRDYVLKLGDPRDIDVFIGGQPSDDMQLPDGWAAIHLVRNGPGEEYHGQVGTIVSIQDWESPFINSSIQFIWIGDNDPVQYVRGFDLGTSKCYYRGSLVLGKDFLHDWHHQEITILASAFQEGRDVGRSRERAQRLQQRYPNGAAIRENIPLNPQLAAAQQLQEFWGGADWPNIIGNQQAQNLAAVENLNAVQIAPVAQQLNRIGNFDALQQFVAAGDMWAEMPDQGAAPPVEDHLIVQANQEWFVR